MLYHALLHSVDTLLQMTGLLTATNGVDELLHIAGLCVTYRGDVLLHIPLALHMGAISVTYDGPLTYSVGVTYNGPTDVLSTILYIQQPIIEGWNTIREFDP